METKKIVSKQFSLQLRDFTRGLVIAILTPALFVIQQSLDKGEWVFNWKSIAIASASGGLAYLFRNFIEPTKTVIVENKK